MRLEIGGHTPEESFLAKVNAQHSNDRASFQIADVIEDLINLKSVPNGYLDGVGCSKRVEMESWLHAFSLR